MKPLPKILTIIPPPRQWDPARVDRKAFEIATLTKAVGIDTVSIPEVIEEKSRGERTVPYRLKVDNTYFGRLLRKYNPDLTIIINKVVPVMEKDEFERWLQEHSGEYQHLVLVGGESSRIQYPGYTPTEAAPIAARYMKHLYGITIFHRRNEARRLLEKTKAGMRAFFSQIIFDLCHVRETLDEYYYLARKEGIQPSRIYVSIAPIARERDLDFIKWLGVMIPYDLEKRFRENPDRMESLSIEVIKGLVKEISEWDYDLGINMEHVMLNNLHLAGYALHRINEIFEGK